MNIVLLISVLCTWSFALFPSLNTEGGGGGGEHGCACFFRCVFELTKMVGILQCSY